MRKAWCVVCCAIHVCSLLWETCTFAVECSFVASFCGPSCARQVGHVVRWETSAYVGVHVLVRLRGAFFQLGGLVVGRSAVLLRFHVVGVGSALVRGRGG